MLQSRTMETPEGDISLVVVPAHAVGTEDLVLTRLRLVGRRCEASTIASCYGEPKAETRFVVGGAAFDREIDNM